MRCVLVRCALTIATLILRIPVPHLWLHVGNVVVEDGENIFDGLGQQACLLNHDSKNEAAVSVSVRQEGTTLRL